MLRTKDWRKSRNSDAIAAFWDDVCVRFSHARCRSGAVSSSRRPWSPRVKPTQSHDDPEACTDSRHLCTSPNICTARLEECMQVVRKVGALQTLAKQLSMAFGGGPAGRNLSSFERFTLPAAPFCGHFAQAASRQTSSRPELAGAGHIFASAPHRAGAGKRQLASASPALVRLPQQTLRRCSE